MAQGIVAGALLGALVSGAGVVALSLALPPAEIPAAVDGAVVAQGAGEEAVGEEAVAVVAPETVAHTGDVPEAGDPMVELVVVVPADGDGDGSPPSEEVPPEGAVVVEESGRAPVVREAGPDEEADPDVSEIAEVVVDPAEVAVIGDEPAAGDGEPAVAGSADGPAGIAAGPVVSDLGTTQPRVPNLESLDEPVPSGGAPAPGTVVVVPDALSAQGDSPRPAAAPEPLPEEPQPVGDTIVIAAVPGAPTRPDFPAGGASEEDGAGDPEQPAFPDASGEGETEVVEGSVPPPSAGPAIEVGAIPFEPTARPMLGVVLLDEGELPEPLLVSGLPFPLSVVVDPLAPDAAERMAFWRSVGAEVALSGGLPRGAGAQDAANAVQAWRDAVPWAVAAVEAEPGVLQADRGALGQLISELGESGHGLVVHSRGLNSARDEALREGVPAGVIFRDIDGAGETPAIIRRFLDQAAFRASRNDGVILLGRTTVPTIETIRDWSTGKRGSTVAIAPLSVMLPREE